ncbi:hypothetical protein KJ680_14315 [bacterium]|nr:hypothetical protein [bacterium]
METVSSDYEALESAQAYLQNKEYDEAIAVLKQADITNSDVNGTLMQAYTLAYLYYVGTSMSGATRDDINLVKAYRIYQEARALNPEHENVTMMADGEQGVIGMRQYVLEGESDATQVSFLEALTAYRRLASISAGGYDKVYSQEATDQAARTEQLTKLQSKIGEYEAARKQVAQIYYDLSGDAKVTVLSAFEEVEFAIFASYAGICQEHSNYTLLLEYYFGISMSVTDKGLSFLSTAVMSEYFQRNSDGTKGRAVWSQFNEMGFNVAIFRGAFDKLQADVTALEGRDDRRAERNKINEILNGGNGTIGIRMVLFQYYSDTRQTDEARAIIADLPDEQRTQMEEQLKAKRNVDSGRSRANDLGDAVRDNRRSGGRSSGGSRGGARPGVVENK